MLALDARATSSLSTATPTQRGFPKLNLSADNVKEMSVKEAGTLSDFVNGTSNDLIVFDYCLLKWLKATGNLIAPSTEGGSK